jgi:outer membrane protein, multidrug efflux system
MLARTDILLFTLLLSGCSLAPTYQRPEMPVLPPTLGEMAPTTAPLQSSPPATLSDEEKRLVDAFSPGLDLGPLVGLALQHNAQYKIALRHVDEARAQYRLERSARMPTVAVQGELKRTQFDNAELDATNREHYAAAGAGLDFDLDFFGRIKSLSQAAQQRYFGSEQGLKAARGALIAEVLRAYTMTVASAQASLTLREADGHQQQFDKYTQRQYELGRISRDQFKQQRMAAARLHAAAVYAETQQRTARRALSILTGFDASATATGALDTIALPVPVASLRDIESTVLLGRPDVRQAEAELKARNADIGAARAAFFPAIHLSTGIGTVSDSLGGLFTSGSRAWTFNPGLTLPIFDGGRNQAQLDVAELRKDAAVAAYEQTISSAFQEVAGALDAQVALAANEAVRREQNELSQARTRAMALRVVRGLQDPTELLAEQIQTHEAALAYIEAARDLALNRIRLLHAFYGTTSYNTTTVTNHD